MDAALKELGYADEVVALSDDLSFGPINPPGPAARRGWIESELTPHPCDLELLPENTADFWQTALAPANRRIVWVSVRSAHEFAGFLESLWRLGDAACELVTFDGDEITYRSRDGCTSEGRAITLGELRPDHLAAKRYWEGATALDAPARERYQANWARLRAEDAPLRILTADGMVSAPITYFDELLIACANEQWRKAARVVGDALWSFLDGPFHQVGHLFLEGRLRALAQAGRLYSVGDLRKPRFSEVRLPMAAGAKTIEMTVS